MNVMKRMVLAVTLAVVTATSAGAVTKPRRTTTFTVGAPATTRCTLSSSSFAFTIGIGYIKAPGNTILKENFLNVACTRGANTQIAMDAGLHGTAAGTQYGSRSMSDGAGSYLGYELCHDTACNSVWSPSGYTYISPTDRGSSLPVWTRILTGQPHLKQGQYTDSVTVTVSF